ncbi:hypothetical protein [Streptomyces scopuliridis]
MAQRDRPHAQLGESGIVHPEARAGGVQGRHDRQKAAQEDKR